MNKYVNKPVFVEAERWDESKQTLDNIGCGFMSMNGNAGTPDLCMGLRIETLNGTIGVDRGDYIVKNGNGNFSVWTEEEFKGKFVVA